MSGSFSEVSPLWLGTLTKLSKLLSSDFLSNFSFFSIWLLPHLLDSCRMCTQFCTGPKTKWNHMQDSGVSFLHGSLVSIPAPPFPAISVAQSYDICLLSPVRLLHYLWLLPPALPFAECLQAESWYNCDIHLMFLFLRNHRSMLSKSNISK